MVSVKNNNSGWGGVLCIVFYVCLLVLYIIIIIINILIIHMKIEHVGSFCAEGDTLFSLVCMTSQCPAQVFLFQTTVDPFASSFYPLQ